MKFRNGSRMDNEFKNLWYEAEWIINSIEREKKKVEEQIKLAKKKKIISSLEFKVIEKQEEIELLVKFREELEKLERLWACEPLSLGAYEPTSLWAYSL